MLLIALVFCLPRTKGAQPALEVVSTWTAHVVDGKGQIRWSAAGPPLKKSIDDHAKGMLSGKADDRYALVDASVSPGNRPSFAVMQDSRLLDIQPRDFAVVPGTKKWHWLLGGQLPSGSKTPMQMGLSVGDWTSVGSVKISASGMGDRSGLGFARMVRPDDHPGTKPDRQVLVDAALPTDTASAYRVVAFDKRGNLLPGIRDTATGKDPSERSFWFAGAYENVGRVVLQKRPYIWLTLPK